MSHSGGARGAGRTCGGGRRLAGLCGRLAGAGGLLTECSKRLEKLQATAAKKGPAADWSSDENVVWLLSNRTPAVMCIARELDTDQPDPYLAALVWVSARLGHRDVLVKLPATLAQADTDEARLSIIKALADMGSPPAVQALEKFLQRATAKTPDDLICTACEGLGRTRDAAKLTQLLMAGRLVRSPLALLRVMAARQQCGDQAAGVQLLAVLRDEKSAAGLRDFVLKFLVEQPMEGTSQLLADVAVSSQDAGTAQLALDALVRATGYDPNVPEAAGAEQDAPAGARLAEFAKLSKDERKKATTAILDWWREHPPAVRQQDAGTADPPPK